MSRMQRFEQELKAWSWRRPLLVFAVIVVLVLSVATAALAQSTNGPSLDANILGLLLEKGGFAAIAIYLIHNQTKTQQATLDAIKETLEGLTDVIQNLKCRGEM